LLLDFDPRLLTHQFDTHHPLPRDCSVPHLAYRTVLDPGVCFPPARLDRTAGSLGVSVFDIIIIHLVHGSPASTVVGHGAHNNARCLVWRAFQHRLSTHNVAKDQDLKLYGHVAAAAGASWCGGLRAPLLTLCGLLPQPQSPQCGRPLLAACGPTHPLTVGTVLPVSQALPAGKLNVTSASSALDGVLLFPQVSGRLLPARRPNGPGNPAVWATLGFLRRGRSSNTRGGRAVACANGGNGSSKSPAKLRPPPLPPTPPLPHTHTTTHTLTHTIALQTTAAIRHHQSNPDGP
jgi:hypothetical protein